MATDALGVAAVDAIVGRRRAELARLSLTARTAAQRCERAEAALSSQPSTDRDAVPADLLAVVDTMLENAVRAAELGLDAARAEARHTVNVALAEATDSLGRLGLDASAVPHGRLPAAPAGRVTPPPSAADLWRTTQRPAPTPTTPVVRPMSSAAAPAPERRSGAPVAGVAPEPARAEVYDIFWQEVPGERRVRDRLLRRSPKEGA